MIIKPFDTRIVHELCSKDQLDLLDSVDRLRSQEIDHYVSLPQIIVCGDQSSGKSSVLEAISGVSFPVKSNLCTRFPTELVLRKTLEIGVSVSIVAYRSCSKLERESLQTFCEILDSFAALPKLIEDAKAAMAIGSLGRAFSKDLLRIEISGPDRPHLTIVDLPGLIHSETKQQSAADIDLVQDVVQSYMKEPRSIILAVVSAKNDYANQIVLKLARAADKAGTRTLGVITKPDSLVPGSASEAMYISLAKILDVEFRLGWHVLKNMDSDTGSWVLSKRDEEEKHFFSKGVWATTDEQRRYLVTLSQACQTLTKAAVDGTYNDEFFGDAKSCSPEQTTSVMFCVAI
jgi:GTP-binding protein EngB required for normal cell division